MNIPAELNRAVALQQQGDIISAQEIYDQVLEIRPNANALHLRGLIRHQCGDSAEGLKDIQQAIAMVPDAAIFRNSHGTILKTLGRLPEAEQEFRTAYEFDNSLIGALNNLAAVLTQRNAFGEAATVLELSLEKGDDSAQTYYQLGVARNNGGQYPQAISAYRESLQRNPGQPTIWNNLGSIYRVQELLPEAIEAFQRATQLQDAYPAAWSNLGATLYEVQQFHEAEYALRKALELKPTFAGAYFNLGNLYQKMGKNRQAGICYREATTLQPNNLHFRMNYVSLLNTLGDFDQAAVQCREIIKRNPRHTQAYYALFTFNAETVTEQEVAQLERLLADSELSDEQKAGAYFSLGKRCDRLGEYDRAFGHFYQANQRTPRRLQFKVGKLRRLVDEKIEVFDKSYFASSKLKGSSSETPIFILGMPRSGSTLVEQIISSHPLVQAGGEFDGIRHLINTFLIQPFQQDNSEASPFPESIRRIDQNIFDEMAECYLNRLEEQAGRADRITDKMPNNAFHLGLITQLFPHATIIYTKRHPLDIGLSCYFQNFTEYHDFSFDLRNTGRFFREHLRMMSHWQSIDSIKLHEIEYETLVQDQEAETHRLIEEICQLPWDNNCLQFHHNPRSVTTASLWQVRQPMYQNSVGKWKNYARHIGPLMEELGLADQSAA